ncbi:UNVERIFIED_CONTAM: putative DNA-binding transcriptional regulator YafY [Paenibacillus sp. PvR008]
MDCLYDLMDAFVVEGGLDLSLPTLRKWMASDDSRTGIPSKIKFTAFGARLAESDPLFQNVSHQEWQGYIPSEEFKYVSRLLLKYSPEAEVIYPEKLRMRVQQLLQDSLNLYLKDAEADDEEKET